MHTMAIIGEPAGCSPAYGGTLPRAPSSNGEVLLDGDASVAAAAEAEQSTAADEPRG